MGDPDIVTAKRKLYAAINRTTYDKPIPGGERWDRAENTIRLNEGRFREKSASLSSSSSSLSLSVNYIYIHLNDKKKISPTLSFCLTHTSSVRPPLSHTHSCQGAPTGARKRTFDLRPAGHDTVSQPADRWEQLGDWTGSDGSDGSRVFRFEARLSLCQTCPVANRRNAVGPLPVYYTHPQPPMKVCVVVVVVLVGLASQVTVRIKVIFMHLCTHSSVVHRSLSQRKRERRVFHFRPNVHGLKAIRYLFVFRTIVCQVHCLSSESWNLSPPPILPVKTTCKGGEGGKWCLTPSQHLRINMMAK